MKYLHNSESILLKFPEYLHQFRSCSVVSVSLSHSGVVIAAVIRVVSNSDHSVAHCVIVWSSAAAGEWKVAGMADLSITEPQQQIDFSSLNKVLVGWSENDSLVVVSTVRTNQEVKSFAREQVRIISAPMSAILSGGLKDAIKSCSCVVNVPTCYVISNFRIFPSQNSNDRQLSLIIASQHKAFLLHLSNVHSSSMIAEVLWSDVSLFLCPTLNLISGRILVIVVPIWLLMSSKLMVSMCPRLPQHRERIVGLLCLG